MLTFAAATALLLGGAIVSSSAKPVQASTRKPARLQPTAAALQAGPVTTDDAATRAPDAFVGVLLPEQATDVAAPQAGLVKAVHAALGQVVDAGQLLVSLSVEQATLDFTRAKAEREAARAGLARARIEQAHAALEADRSEQLAREGLATEAQLAEARFKFNTGKVLSAEAESRLAERSAHAEQLAVVRDQASVLASFRGRVAVRYVSPGTLVAAGTPLLRLISDEAVLLRFAIPEQENAVQVGSQVMLVPDEHPETQLAARVVRVAPEIDAASRMRTVEAMPLNPKLVVSKGLVGAIVRVRPWGAPLPAATAQEGSAP